MWDTISENDSTTEKILLEPTVFLAPVHFIDERGYLMKMIRSADIPSFGEIYLIGDWAAGVIRAFHKHTYTEEWFTVISGTAKFLLYDDRPQSPRCGEVQSFVLSVRRPEVLFVPAEVFHGHMALENQTQILTVASHPYNPQEPDEVRAPHDSFGVEWMTGPK